MIYLTGLFRLIWFIGFTCKTMSGCTNVRQRVKGARLFLSNEILFSDYAFVELRHQKDLENILLRGLCPVLADGVVGGACPTMKIFSPCQKIIEGKSLLLISTFRMGASAAGISIIARGGGTRADMLIETMLHPLATQTTICGTPLFGGGGGVAERSTLA